MTTYVYILSKIPPHHTYQKFSEKVIKKKIWNLIAFAFGLKFIYNKV